MINFKLLSKNLKAHFQIFDLIYLILSILIVVYVLNNYNYFINNYIGGDESRYLYFAKNLQQGIYSPTNINDIRLWFGPGYPIILSILIKLGLKYQSLRYFNLVLLLLSYTSIFFTIKIIKPMDKFKYFFVALIFAPLGNPIDFYVLHTESLVFFIISIITYFIVKEQIKTNTKNQIYIGLLIGILSLVKPIFVYACLIYLLYCLFRYLKSKKVSFLQLKYALIFIIPYLFYTYTLTNKYLYTSTAGGMQFYCMSIRDSNHTGEWLSKNDLIKINPELENLKKLGELQCDEIYKSNAIKNIKEKPINYIKNLISNAFRLFIYRYSYDGVSSMMTFIINMCVIFYLIVNIKNLFKLEIIKFFFIYLILSLFFSAYFRFFNILYPLFICLIIYQIETKRKIS